MGVIVISNSSMMWKQVTPSIFALTERRSPSRANGK
jgi:hypothetical protein